MRFSIKLLLISCLFASALVLSTPVVGEECQEGKENQTESSATSSSTSASTSTSISTSTSASASTSIPASSSTSKSTSTSTTTESSPPEDQSNDAQSTSGRRAPTTLPPIGNELGRLTSHLSNQLMMARESQLNPINFFRSSSNRHSDFDYLLLSVHWPIHLCDSNRCVLNPIQKWAIHGLWPNKIRGGHPADCDTSQRFKDSDIADIRDELEKKWFSVLIRNTNANFWNHEWSKHGTCAYGSEAGKSQRNYFQTTLRMFDHNPVQQWLEDAKLFPSDDPKEVLDINRFYYAIGIHRSGQFTLGCRFIKLPDKHGRVVKHPVIESINFCYDKSLNLTDCPNTRTSCPPRVLYPTYKLTRNSGLPRL